MGRRRTYIDANVLIAAWNGDTESRSWARAALDDPERILVVSDFVRLEVLPKPTFYQRRAEVAFMETIIAAAEHAPLTAKTLDRAIAIAGDDDLSPLDALHLAIAAESGVDEVLTFERPDKPMCRQNAVRVVSLRALRDAFGSD
jgi:predicted nucleic acid-binding protein